MATWSEHRAARDAVDQAECEKSRAGEALRLPQRLLVLLSVFTVNVVLLARSRRRR